MRIVFFGTANTALPVLETLYRHHDIAAVVTSPDALAGRRREIIESPVSVLAKEMDLPLLKPERVKNNADFLKQLTALAADIFIVVAYGKILPREIIHLPRLKTLNVHFSLLPKYRGASPIQFALLNGDALTGTSIFVLDEQMDTGPILAQAEMKIDPDDNYITLSQKLAYRSADLILDTLPRYASGELTPRPQSEEQATYTRIITKDDGRIDWQQEACQIYNRFRAFYPWPGIWTIWHGKKLKVLDCLPENIKEFAGNPGSVKSGGLVICGKGTGLNIRRLQLEGKSPVDTKSFLNGYPDFIGSTLG